MAAVDLLRVPYKGGPQAVADVIAGHVSLMFPSMPTGYPHVKSGKVRALAVTGAKRSMLAAELPTMAEAGLTGYEANQWWGVAGRAGTSKEIIGKLNAEIMRLLGLADVKERLAAQGVETTVSTSEQFAIYIQAEIVKWGKVVKGSGARID